MTGPTIDLKWSRDNLTNMDFQKGESDLGPRDIQRRNDLQEGGNGTDLVAEDRTPSPSHSDSDAIEIEKKWLQLARIDSEKFAFFFEKYYDRIFRYLFWKTANEDLAADLTAEVFTRALERLDRFTWQGYSFGAWLFQIARFTAGTEFARRKVRDETEFVPDVHQGVTNESPELIAEQAQDNALLRECLDRLEAVRHEVFVLHYWSELSASQIGLLLEMPLGTVKTHLRRGREQLLKCLQRRGLERGLSNEARQLVADKLDDLNHSPEAGDPHE